VKTGDIKAEWDYEPACRESYEYQADTDLFKGKTCCSCGTQPMCLCTRLYSVSAVW
jgi:hypothetical protein